jgi:hypothetical protein
MADEVNFSWQLTSAKSGEKPITWTPGSQQLDKAVLGSASRTVPVTTDEGSFTDFGGITTLGVVFIENAGSNPIRVGQATTSYFARLEAGEAFPMRLDQGITEIFHISVGGNSTLKIGFLEN